MGSYGSGETIYFDSGTIKIYLQLRLVTGGVLTKP